MPRETFDEPCDESGRSQPFAAGGDALWRRRRSALLVLAAVVVLLGLLLRSLPGAIGDLGGGVLYAVLLFLLVAVVVPAERAVRIGLISFAVCAAIELLQVTGFPTVVATLVPPIRYVLGTTFVASDLLAYAAGTVLAVCADRLVKLAAGRRPSAHDAQ